jgi:hypothetical protein
MTEQLEFFALTKEELHILAGITQSSSVSAYCREHNLEDAPIYNLCKRVCPLHDKGELWKPYIVEWMGKLSSPIENIYEEI